MSSGRISSIGRRQLAHDISKILTVGLPMSYGSQSGSLCGWGHKCSDRGNVRVLGSTITLLAFALTLTGTTSTMLPMRLLLVGGTGSRGWLLVLLLVTLLCKARVTTLALNSGNLLHRLCSLMLSMVSLSLKLTYDLTGDIIQF